MSSPSGTSEKGNGVPSASSNGSSSGASARHPLAPRASVAARAAAIGAVVAAVIVVLILILGGGSAYVVSADFQDASGLVTGNNVLIGPAAVGTVSSIGLTANGQARVKLSLHGTGSLHQGTVARIYEDSLSGIASKYVELEPGPPGATTIPSGGTIGEGDTYSEVNIDELFDTFDARTRTGLSNLIRGEAASLRGKGKLANRTLEYLAPGLESTSAVTGELTRNEPAFDGLVVQGANAMRALASRSTQLTQLIANTSTATGAIARESQSLQRALSLLPGALRGSTTTFAGLNTTLDALDPLVAASKPASRQLPQFAASLNALNIGALPTVAKLNDLLVNPKGTGDLTSLSLATPSLASAANRAFPTLIHNFTESRPQMDYLREYAPDVIAALTNLGQVGANYDANGHFVRTQPDLFPFTTNSMNQLVMQNPADRYNGLTHVSDRCPGSAVQAAPDGSAPRATAGCSTTAVPPGP